MSDKPIQRMTGAELKEYLLRSNHIYPQVTANYQTLTRWELEELNNLLSEFRELIYASVDYINKSPTEPDILPEQHTAYHRYKKALKILEERGFFHSPKEVDLR